MKREESVFSEITYCFHPSFQFSKKDFFSLKNLNTLQQCANAAVGFLSAFSFLERCNLFSFPENAFGLDEKLLPKIDISKFGKTEKNDDEIIKELLKNIFFKDKDVSRGKFPKNLKETSFLIRNLQKQKAISANELLLDILETLKSDGISISLPPLWSIGVHWEPSDDLLS
ncbi:MAG: hypothetical protein N2445_09200, partial [Acidobacteria bacterium]|nr:hypothetical protein [Acidobacteriota bacterium]